VETAVKPVQIQIEPFQRIDYSETTPTQHTPIVLDTQSSFALQQSRAPVKAGARLVRKSVQATTKRASATIQSSYTHVTKQHVNLESVEEVFMLNPPKREASFIQYHSF